MPVLFLFAGNQQLPGRSGTFTPVAVVEGEYRQATLNEALGEGRQAEVLLGAEAVAHNDHRGALDTIGKEQLACAVQALAVEMKGFEGWHMNLL
jgi:hypothetical protein